MSVKEFLEGEKKAEEKLKTLVEPLKLDPATADRFYQLVKEQFFPSHLTPALDWSLVKPVSSAKCFQYSELSDPADPAAILKHFAFGKLVGGLGTTMGCTFAKTLMECQGGKRFLDIMMMQIRDLNKKYGVKVPMVMMTSFYTETDMTKAIAEFSDVDFVLYNQSTMPRIYCDTLEPVPQSPDAPTSHWFSPGHADAWLCLGSTGKLDELLARGIKYLMMSNCDNMGGYPDLRILNKLATENLPYIAEFVPKLPADWKGGTVIEYGNGVRLLEWAQVPVAHQSEFKDVSIFPTFHTNNLWINLEALKKGLAEKTIKLDAFLNKKAVDGRPIWQIEAAAGSVIQSWPEARAVVVDRLRFLPVKVSSDIIVMRSDLYVCSDAGVFSFNPARKAGLGFPYFEFDANYQLVSDVERHFPHPVSMVNIHNLIVHGDVSAGSGVSLAGDVTFEIPKGEKVVLPDGLKLENVTITSQADVDKLK